MLYILKIKGTNKIPDFVQINLDSTLAAQFVDGPLHFFIALACMAFSLKTKEEAIAAKQVAEAERKKHAAVQKKEAEAAARLSNECAEVAREAVVESVRALDAHGDDAEISVRGTHRAGKSMQCQPSLLRCSL